MKRVTAHQVPPEWQESPLDYISRDEWPQNIAVYGNRHYNEHIPGPVAAVLDVLDELQSDLDDVSIDPDSAAFESRPEAISYHLGQDLTPAQVEQIDTAIIEKYGYGNKDDEAKADILSAVTGHTWKSAVIRGTCQGDWQKVLFDMDEITPEDLERFEADYWNTGEEYEIETDDGESWTMYVYAWRTDDKRREIADCAGCTPDAVTLYEFDGWNRSPKYKEAV